MEILGRREKPRLLAVGVEEAEPLGVELKGMVPTVHFLGDRPLASVRQADFDAVVLVGDNPGLEQHTFVVQFGGYSGDLVIRGVAHGILERSGGTVSQEYVIPEGLPRPVAQLVRSHLAPSVMAASRSSTIEYRGVRRTGPGEHPDLSDLVGPFLVDADGLIVAGRNRRKDASEWWSLPAQDDAAAKWVAAALEVWSEHDSERFPSGADWTTRDEWMSERERSVVAEASALEAEHGEAVSAYLDAKARLSLAQREATQTADDGERRLLTAQGEELVEEVMNLLRELGFDVQDVDHEIASQGDRREDVRANEVVDGLKWTAIGEVRGYSKGAQVNDLMRLGRFARRFVKDEQREPDSCWYVVNQFRLDDPATRPAPLASNPLEVETFAEDGGLVIDTVQLFQLRRRVRQGTLPAGDARALLRESRGILILP